ncbi:hypothetical protein [Nocardioides deserti]|uniref:Uncharacterized protein n=1 Tax=Nocardioides deserti TaxID=1588644 RepID=A0ABR6U8Y0_9ACTN|nr:hypothetical protein [Nocardioides deserti]MBC2960900.1 hypothetical protein [Nocardioides deserti]GGO77719.1 hypothetical protein GCM10012276_33480 [Nocardioides deserti]
MKRSRTAALIAPLVLSAGLLAGCGGDGGDEVASDRAATSSASSEATPSGDASATASSSPSAGAGGPDCAEVWVAGGTLPGGYQECYEDGERVKANGRYCEFGKPLITYGDRFWAVPGGRIGESRGALLDDAAYEDALRKCSG